MGGAEIVRRCDQDLKGSDVGCVINVGGCGAAQLCVVIDSGTVEVVGRCAGVHDISGVGAGVAADHAYIVCLGIGLYRFPVYAICGPLDIDLACAQFIHNVQCGYLEPHLELGGGELLDIGAVGHEELAGAGINLACLCWDGQGHGKDQNETDELE